MGRGLRLLGISISKLAHSPHLQLELPFELMGRHEVSMAGSTAALERDALDDAIDELRERFGKYVVGPGSHLLGLDHGLVPEEFGDLAVPASERRPAR